MISTKGKRKLEYNGINHYWYIRRDSDYIPCIHIAAEVESQDIHQSIVIGVAAIIPHSAQADSLMDEIVCFVEENTEAEIVAEERELR